MNYSTSKVLIFRFLVSEEPLIPCVTGSRTWGDDSCGRTSGRFIERDERVFQGPLGRYETVPDKFWGTWVESGVETEHNKVNGEGRFENPPFRKKRKEQNLTKINNNIRTHLLHEGTNSTSIHLYILLLLWTYAISCILRRIVYWKRDGRTYRPLCRREPEGIMPLIFGVLGFNFLTIYLTTTLFLEKRKSDQRLDN